MFRTARHYRLIILVHVRNDRIQRTEFISPAVFLEFVLDAVRAQGLSTAALLRAEQRCPGAPRSHRDHQPAEQWPPPWRIYRARAISIIPQDLSAVI